MCFTETWLQEQIITSTACHTSCQTILADKNGESKEEGTAALVDKRWYNPEYNALKEKIFGYCNVSCKFLSISSTESFHLLHFGRCIYLSHCQCNMQHYQLSNCQVTNTTSQSIHGYLWRFQPPFTPLLHFQLLNSLSTAHTEK